ncbi:restriction endonuclease subunit S [Candidatus Enterococcus clewellii]|uniref:Type I restriction enzyme, S subunit n=2 Tax=Candidatus Enterococcus clewellii TaxID=1834193 RepID=A0AAQ3XZM7_9ENTE
MKGQDRTPKLRFKGFSDDWEQRELGEIVEITMGQSPSSENYTDNPDDYILVQGNADMKNGRVVPRVWTTQVTKEARRGDLILSVRAPVGDIGKTDFEVVLGRGVAGIKGNEFVFQSLGKMKQNGYWNKLSTGSTFESINSNDIKEAKIFIPKEKEQKKIGSYFKQLDNTIALHLGKVDALKQIKKGFLQQLFPRNGKNVPGVRFTDFHDEWEQCKLGEVSSRHDNLRIPITASNRVTGTTPYYGANGIQDYVEGFTHDGEFILVAEDGANDLVNYPVRYVKGKVWVNNHAHVLQAKEKKSDSIFLMYSLQNTNIEPFLVGGGRAKLNANILMNLEILMPSLEEQLEIGIFIKKIDDSIFIQQKRVEQLKTLKKSYLQNMFI